MNNLNIIIPARAGSKGITNKNIKKVGDKKLYERSIEHALKISNKYKKKIFLTTNISDILDSKNLPEEIILHERPKDLCGDKVLTFDVVIDIIKTFNLDQNALILLLQPTTPFREINEIEKGIEFLLQEKKWNSVVSLSDVSGIHPFRMKRIVSDNECIDFIDNGFEDMRPRQSLPKVFIRSGSFYLARISSALKVGHLLPKPCKAIIHENKNIVINIDNEIDLEIANLISRNKCI